MVTVPVSKHIAWHILFKNYDVHAIATVINETWLDPDFVLVVQRKGV
jgi:hypothetical protein